VIFSPKPSADGVGNGVHIHMSLQDASGTPITYAPEGRMGLSDLAQQFCAGILHHLPALAAITAPSPVSYLRLTPNRWAPTAVDIVQQDRGASLRVCPVFAAAGASEIARQYNFEFRATDASASPYMALGAVVFAGADGIARGLTLPAQGADSPALPRALAEALDTMEASAAVQAWFGPTFMEAYLRHKRAELATLTDLEPEELCDRYAKVY
jgi:glutamine synthetase